MVNGNICLQDRFLKLPKMQPVKIKNSPYDPGGMEKSVTVSREPSGKYFASLLFEENQTAEKDLKKKKMDFAMHGMYFLPVMFYRNAKKACEQKMTYQKQKKRLLYKKIKNQRKDFSISSATALQRL